MFTTRNRRLLALATLAGATAALAPMTPAEAAVDTAPPVVTVTLRDADRLGWHRLATVPVTVQVRDVGSGVDQAPGDKSPERIAALFDALRAPCRQEQDACA